MTLQRKATVTASATALFLIIVKLIVGMATGTVVIIASAIDSGLDFCISLFNAYAVSKAEQPMDTEYNYGRGKIEGLASVIEGTIIVLSGFFIVYAAIDKLYHEQKATHLDWSLYVMLASIVLTTFLVIFLNNVYKKTKNLVVKSDALHYKSDLYANIGIIASLIVIYFTEWHFIDPVVSVAIAIYVIYSAYGIIKEGLNMLLDRALDDETVTKIKAVLDQHIQEDDFIMSGYHFLRTRKSGNINFVDVHVVFNDKVLLKESHQLADHIEESIMKLDTTTPWIINIHQDPYDDKAVNEQLLKQQNLSLESF